MSKRKDEEASETFLELERAGLGLQQVGRRDGILDIHGYQKIKVGEIGDLDLLIADYANAGIPISTSEDYARAGMPNRVGMVPDIGWGAHGRQPVAAYRNNYDEKPRWLTGLLLGYPIENTIALMLGK